MDAKQKIDKSVKDYIQMFPEEFEAFKKAHRIKVDMQANKFASSERDSMVERALHDVPETLYSSLRLKLNDDEFNYFPSKAGARWFAKKYPVFAVAKEI